MPAPAPFDERYTPELNTGCFIWSGPVITRGYGQLRVNKRLVLAHRYAWERTHGSIPDGLCVLHKCDVRLCVNPDHLFLGTKGDNARDRDAKGRNRHWEGILARAILTPADIPKIRADTRDPRIIAQEYGVKRPAIRRVQTRTSWASIP